jgi:hypothetical protein
MKMRFIAITVLLIPFLAFAQDSGKKKAYYFYGEQCPHCKNVDDYFKANGIYEKYSIEKLEFSNPFNSRLLMKFGDVFESKYKGSVPAVAFGDKFIVGDQPIIDGFVKEIDAAENADELPDPDKMLVTVPEAGLDAQSVGENSGQSGDAPDPADNGQGGNKNRYFPVILLALIVIGGGALIFINRKPKE